MTRREWTRQYHRATKLAGLARYYRQCVRESNRDDPPVTRFASSAARRSRAMYEALWCARDAGGVD